jgi:ATP-binding cassette subfamily B protein
VRPKQKSLAGGIVVSTLKAHRLVTFFLICAVFGAAAAQTIPAFIIKKIIDDNFVKGIADGIWRLAVLYFLCAAGTHVIDFFKAVCAAALGQNILSALKLAAKKKMHELPMSYFTRTPAGAVMSRLTSDVDAVETLFSAGLIDAATDLLKIAGIAASLYALSPRLFVAELFAVPAVFAAAVFFRKRSFKAELDTRRRIADIFAFAQEWLRAKITVKAYALESLGKEKFQKPLSRHIEAMNSVSFYDSAFPCVMQIIRTLVIALSLWLCVRGAGTGGAALSAGVLAASADLIARLFAPIEAAATEFQTIQQALSGLERVKDFFAEPSELSRRETAPCRPDFSRGIEMSGVSFSYDSERARVLDNVSFTVNAGEKIALTGRSGEGKTSLLNLAAGLYPPDAGCVRVCGVNPHTIASAERRKLLGVVPQTPQLFNGTARENITLGDADITEDDVTAALKLAGMDEKIAALPRGLDTVLGEDEAGLSTGETQLLSIARAVAANPRILLLDEPSSGMDSKTEALVFEALRRAEKGRTILSVSHSLKQASGADKVFEVKDGKISPAGRRRDP